MNFKPMLAASLDGVDLATLRYPLLASPKLDGVRCVLWEGVAYTRNAKPVRNRFIQNWARDKHNMDGELIVGSPTDPLCLNTTQSGVMSFEGEPDFTFHLFDCIEGPSKEFNLRLDWVQSECVSHRVVAVPHTLVYSAMELVAVESMCLARGYEGVMLRSTDGPYKHGRSTLREGYLMKLKRFQDGEAFVLRVEEGFINENELERDELGRAKRSKDSANLVPSGMVGSIICHTTEFGELRIAPGIMTHTERQHYLQHPGELVGKTIHWRSFGYGVKDKPRFPRFYGVRHDLPDN